MQTHSVIIGAGGNNGRAGVLAMAEARDFPMAMNHGIATCGEIAAELSKQGTTSDVIEDDVGYVGDLVGVTAFARRNSAVLARVDPTAAL
jgi:hypothetical protein